MPNRVILMRRLGIILCDFSVLLFDLGRLVGRPTWHVGIRLIRRADQIERRQKSVHRRLVGRVVSSGPAPGLVIGEDDEHA